MAGPFQLIKCRVLHSLVEPESQYFQATQLSMALCLQTESCHPHVISNLHHFEGTPVGAEQAGTSMEV